MPRVKEFYLFKKMEQSETIILGTLVILGILGTFN
jgi:hypothetical protein